ncbi:MAG: hypothetical protein RLZZ65_835 [Bacteroidota bacterium]|jgi:iron complex outermembrane receptor protein
METNNSIHLSNMFYFPFSPFKAKSIFFALFTVFFTSIYAQDPLVFPIKKQDSLRIQLEKISRTITMHEVALIAGRNGGSFYSRTQSIEKLNAIDLKLLPVRSIPEALALVGGVDVRQRGLSGTQADIGIRGGNFEQSLIVVNGFKMTDPQTGHHAASLPIPLIAISEIQVFKSPTVLQFGQSALTGAVHIGAYPTGPFEVKASTYGGSFNSFGAQAMVRMKIKKFHQLIAVSRDQSAGHWYNSDFVNHQLFYTGSHSLGKQNGHSLSYLAAYTDRNFGANGFYSNKFPDQWEHTTMAMAGIKHNFHFPRRENLSMKQDHRNLHFKQQLLVRSHADEFRLKRLDPSFYTNTHVSNVLSYELQGSFYINRHKLDIGVEERLEQLNSSNLGLRQRDYQSVYLQSTGSISNFRYAAGLLFFAYNWQNPQLMPSLQIGTSFKRQQFIFANYSRGNRVPSWTEMYYSDPSNVGNPNLLPEYSHAVEMGWRLNPSKDLGFAPNYTVQAEANLFYRQHTNMIDWVRVPSVINPNPNPWMPVNIANVAFKGLETSFQMQTNLRGTWGLNHLKLNYTYITAKHNFSSTEESRYALTSMKQQFNTVAVFDLSQYVHLSLVYRLVERIEQPLYQVFDAKLNVTIFNKWSVFAEANNLTNTQYVEAGFVQMPGRWFKVGLSFTHKAIENPRP